MKVLFLDIDGVLNCDTTKERLHDGVFRGALGIDETLRDRYLGWLEGKEITVVLSSTWRTDERLEAELARNGIFYSDKTEIKSETFRGNQIEAWLSKHPEVTEYAILDDIQWFHIYQQNHLVLTKPKIGLTDEDLVQVEKILDLNE